VLAWLCESRPPARPVSRGPSCSSPVSPLLLSAALGAFRDSITSATAVLVLVLFVVAMAASGDRLAGVLQTAEVAAGHEVPQDELISRVGQQIQPSSNSIDVATCPIPRFPETRRGSPRTAPSPGAAFASTLNATAYPSTRRPAFLCARGEWRVVTTGSRPPPGSSVPLRNGEVLPSCSPRCDDPIGTAAGLLPDWMGTPCPEPQRVLRPPRGRAGLELQWAGTAKTVRARRGEPTARIAGPPGELLLYIFGRQGAARVEVSGPAAAVEAMRRAARHEAGVLLAGAAGLPTPGPGGGVEGANLAGGEAERQRPGVGGGLRAVLRAGDRRHERVLDQPTEGDLGLRRRPVGYAPSQPRGGPGRRGSARTGMSATGPPLSSLRAVTVLP
jgi:hypothetical protein